MATKRGFIVKRLNRLYYYGFFIALWNHYPLTSQINIIQPFSEEPASVWGGI